MLRSACVLQSTRRFRDSTSSFARRSNVRDPKSRQPVSSGKRIGASRSRSGEDHRTRVELARAIRRQERSRAVALRSAPYWRASRLRERGPDARIARPRGRRLVLGSFVSETRRARTSRRTRTRPPATTRRRPTTRTHRRFAFSFGRRFASSSRERSAGKSDRERRRTRSAALSTGELRGFANAAPMRGSRAHVGVDSFSARLFQKPDVPGLPEGHERDHRRRRDEGPRHATHRRFARSRSGDGSPRARASDGHERSRTATVAQRSAELRESGPSIQRIARHVGVGSFATRPRCSRAIATGDGRSAGGARAHVGADSFSTRARVPAP